MFLKMKKKNNKQPIFFPSVKKITANCQCAKHVDTNCRDEKLG